MNYKTVLILVVVVMNLQARPLHHQLENYSFDEFIVDFNRDYIKGSEQYEYKKKVFEENLASIKNHNSIPNLTWKQGVNEHTDQTEEEFVKEKQLIKRQSTKKFMGFTRSIISLQQKIENLEKQESRFPQESVDWRDYINEARSQGQCGSCWTFATAGTVEGHLNIYNGGDKKYLSTQQIVSCCKNEKKCGGTGGCHGGTGELAMDYIRTNGIVTEEQYPYVSGNNGTEPQCTYDPASTAPYVTLEDWVMLERNNEQQVIDALTTVGPLIISAYATKWKQYESGIFSGCSYQENVDINHAIVLVGYGSENGTDYWIVRNSWGTKYGENGHIRVLRESQVKCGVDTTPEHGYVCQDEHDPQVVCGMCGILSDTSYPIGVKYHPKSSNSNYNVIF